MEASETREDSRQCASSSLSVRYPLVELLLTELCTSASVPMIGLGWRCGAFGAWPAAAHLASAGDSAASATWGHVKTAGKSLRSGSCWIWWTCEVRLSR